MSSDNVPLKPGFTLVCVIPGVHIGSTSPASFEERIGKTLGVRVQFLEVIETFPDRDEHGNDVPDTGGRKDLFFAVHEDDDSPTFNVERMARGIRWLEDTVSKINRPHGILYPARVLDYLDPRVRKLVT